MKILQALLALARAQILALTARLAVGQLTINEWAGEVLKTIATYHVAAFLGGANTDTLNDAARIRVAEQVATQAQYLDKFASEMKAAPAFETAWSARATMYAEAIKAPYWLGITRMLPLPALPGDGSTICLTNCKCAWRIEQLAGDENWNAYWERHVEDSCQTCVERESQWNPLNIREGVLQI